MKQVAIQACRDIVANIIDGNEAAWRRVDKIEKRFKIQGATDSMVEAFRNSNRDFLRTESNKHDLANPDRFTYLHR
jgi:hypothetical protein